MDSCDYLIISTKKSERLKPVKEELIILETVFAVIIAGAVAPSRAVGQMHAGFFCLSALLRLSD